MFELMKLYINNFQFPSPTTVKLYGAPVSYVKVRYIHPHIKCWLFGGGANVCPGGHPCGRPGCDTGPSWGAGNG